MPFRTEVATTFELHAALAHRVAATAAQGRIPLVLSGNCGAALGTVAGLALAGAADVGVVWLDAHGEFNTPDTTTSGFLDGMGLATMTGHAWRALAAAVPGFRVLSAERLLLVGTRDLDPAEAELLRRSRVGVADAERIRRDGVERVLGPALDALAAHVRRVYLHLDVDVLDPTGGRGNAFASPGGLSADDVLATVAAVRRRFAVAAAGIASYDPAGDADGRVARLAARVLGAVSLHARASSSGA